ncbi:MAG: metallophosphoesterase [Anaerovoracaceae bacterium]
MTKKIIKGISIFLFIFIIIVVILLCKAFIIEPHQITTKKIDLTQDKIKKDIKIAVFSDTHIGSDYSIDDLNKAISAINNETPDLVFFIGDLIDNYQNNKIDSRDISNALGNINSKLGKYAVFGNHDYGGGAEHHYENIMNAGDFTVLKNNNITIYGQNLTITGIDDFLIGYGNIAAANSLPNSSYNIVLCHEPDKVDELLNKNVDLYLGGHSHGGQINLPFVQHEFYPYLGKKYTYGLYNVNNIKTYVNPGLGTTKIAARLFVPPEITIITLKQEK